MRFAAIDASPRGAGSNSATILGWTLAGLKAAGADVPAVVHLAESRDDPGTGAAMKAAVEADAVIIAFPLYTDFVPGLLKAFLDAIAADGSAALAGKSIAWIAHAGFPESSQIDATARWLARATARLGATCAGVAIKGGSEGYRLMPQAMTGRARRLFAEAGESLASTGSFDPTVLERLARPRALNWAASVAIRLLAPTGVLNGYWNAMLRRHGAMGRRFDAPYGEAYRGD